MASVALKPPVADATRHEMRSRRLGATGLTVSEYGIGCQSFGGGLLRPVDQGQALQIIRMAYDHGVNFFDTTQSYGEFKAERLLGEAFRGQRDRVVLAAKIGEHYPAGLALVARARFHLKPLRPVLAPLKNQIHKAMYAFTRFSYAGDHIVKAVENTLRAIGTDYLDLVQMHCPPADVLERGEFLATLRALRDQGKVRHFGVYTMSIGDSLIALKHAEIAAIQVPFNLLNQRAANELLPEAAKRNVAIIVKQAVAHGLLTDDIEPHKAEVMAPDLERFRSGYELAQRFRFLARDGRTMAQSALAFALSFPEVSVAISGIATEAQLVENLGFVSAPPLTAEEKARAIALGRREFTGY